LRGLIERTEIIVAAKTIVIRSEKVSLLIMAFWKPTEMMIRSTAPLLFIRNPVVIDFT